MQLDKIMTQLKYLYVICLMISLVSCGNDPDKENDDANFDIALEGL